MSLGQAFNVAPAHPSGATLRNDYVGTPSLGTDSFFRISNVNGLVAAPSPDSALATVATATTAGPANIDNHLNRVGQFTFTADNPILNVSLTLGVNSIYTENFGAQGNLVGGDNFFDRSAFLMHDFGLLFEGNGGARFALTRFTDPVAGRLSADENFAVVEPAGGGFTLEYVPVANLDPDSGELVPLTDQIRSLEWLGVGANDAAWDPTGDSFPFDDTFPVAADAAIPPTFFMERGIDTGAAPLYTVGGNNTVWNVYLFSTGPIGSNLQLNLSQIQVTLSVPEASDALAAGVGLILVAGVIRSRMRA